jgi:hypothetical protein
MRREPDRRSSHFNIARQRAQIAGFSSDDDCGPFVVLFLREGIRHLGPQDFFPCK